MAVYLTRWELVSGKKYGWFWMIVGDCRLKKSIFIGNVPYFPMIWVVVDLLGNQLGKLYLPVISAPDLGVIVDDCGWYRVLQIPDNKFLVIINKLCFCLLCFICNLSIFMGELRHFYTFPNNMQCFFMHFRDLREALTDFVVIQSTFKLLCRNFKYFQVLLYFNVLFYFKSAVSPLLKLDMKLL